MLKMRKVLTGVLVAVMAVSLLAGCKETKSKGSKSKDSSVPPAASWIYSCNPDNMIGFEGYFCNGDTLCIVFDKDCIDESNIPSALSYVAKDCKEWPEYYDIYVYDGDNNVFWAEPQNISAESEDGKLIISFELDDVRPNEIAEICIEYDCKIYTEDGVITVQEWGGEWSCEYTQVYDAGDDEWGEVEAEETLWEFNDECY